MRNFVYYTPTKVIFGRGTELDAGRIIQSYGFQRVLLHYGSGSVKKYGVLDRVTDSLRCAGIGFAELGGVETNPKIGMVRRGIEICRKEGIELVLAVGGGSVIDSAKLIAVGACHPGTDPWQFSSKEKVPERALPVGVVLTLAASGSEMSASCVITNEENSLKRGFVSEYNRPLFAIMNPELTYTVSPFQTACGVVDILMHTIERYFMPEQESELTDSLSEALMRSVIESGKTVMTNPQDYDARATLMWAGSLSHNGLTGAGKQEGLALHQLEHEISGAYDEVAHAAGLSALFPAWATYVRPADNAKFVRFAVNVWGCRMDAENPDLTALAGIERCRAYFADVLRMPISLHELGIGDDRFEEMAVKCTYYGRRIIPGIMELQKEDILNIFHLAE
ncbi:MAG: iron-containing alcohol dehydrogenase [Saccharofermentanales bacterium]